MKNNYFNKKNIMLLFVICMIAFILSCEKEIGVDPIPTERPITGTLVDADNHNIKISNAIVAITPIDPSIDFPTILTTSDENGFFQVTTMVLPASQPYQLQIDATNSGYQIKDTVVSCNCDVLELNFIKLKKLSCGISLSPSIINFGNSFIGVQKSLTIILSNPSLTDLKITNITLTNSAFSFDEESIDLPYLLAPGDEKSLLITFLPNEEIEYSDSILISTDCDVNSEITAPIIGSGLSQPCGIQLNPNVIMLPSDFAIKDTINYDITINSSPDAIVPVEIDSIFNPFGDDVFYNEDEIIGRQIQPGSNLTFTLFITTNEIKRLLDSLKFYTSCNDTSYSTLVIDGKSNQRECEISTNGDFSKLGLATPNVTFTIKNISDVLDLDFEITPLISPYTITPQLLSGTLAPGESRLFTISFDINAPKQDSLQNIIVNTNGNCNLDEQLFASFYIPGVKKATIFRWIPDPPNQNQILSNPDYIFWGFDFDSDRQESDSINICGSSVNFPSNNSSNCDFRFNYIANYFNGASLENTAYISVHKKWGDLRQTNNFGVLDFDVDEYQQLLTSNLLNPNFLQNGCNIPELKADDVIAIESNNDDLFIVRVYTVSRRRDTILSFEELTIEYFKYKKPSFMLNSQNN